MSGTNVSAARLPRGPYKETAAFGQLRLGERREVEQDTTERVAELEYKDGEGSKDGAWPHRSRNLQRGHGWQMSKLCVQKKISSPPHSTVPLPCFRSLQCYIIPYFMMDAGRDHIATLISVQKGRHLSIGRFGSNNVEGKSLGRSIQSCYLSGRINGADFVLCRNASGTRLFMPPSLLRRRLGDARHQNKKADLKSLSSALRSRWPFTYFLNQNKKRRVYIPSGTRGIGSRVPASSSKCTSQTG